MALAAGLPGLNGIDPARVEPGQSTANGDIESINGWLRDEFLNANQLLSIEDTRNKIDA